MSEEKFKEGLNTLITANVSAIIIRASEIERAMRVATSTCAAREILCRVWSPARGWRQADGNPFKEHQWKVDQRDMVGAMEDVISGIGRGNSLSSTKREAYFFAYLVGEWHTDGVHADLFEHVAHTAMRADKLQPIFICVMQDAKIPATSVPTYHIIDFEMPGKEVIEKTIERWSTRKTNPFHYDSNVANYLVGLSEIEYQNAMLISAAKNNCKVVTADVRNAKQEAIKKSGMLQVVESKIKNADIGGLKALKNWLLGRKKIFASPDLAKKFDLPSPKGIVLLGIPGTGKSLAAKFIGNEFGIMTLQLDVSKVFSKYVGESELQMRQTLALVESMAPCILWIDELEKGLAGIQSSGQSDSGVTARVIGSFLQWLQEKTAAVFVVATVNNVAQLPPELLRKGRFDEIFFVDLPKTSERLDIIKIHATKNGINLTDGEMDAIVQMTVDFTGSEIEQALIAAKITAFNEDPEHCAINISHIESEISMTRPLAVTMSEIIAEMRKWAQHRARAASEE